MSARVHRIVLALGGAPVARVVLSTPEGPGQVGQFSALERCRAQAANAQASRESALLSAGQAQVASASALSALGEAQAARDAALQAVGGVKVTPDDTVPRPLDQSLAVDAPLVKAVQNPGGQERLLLSLPDMAGATDQAPGLPGAVPAPQAGEQGRFLGGDGLWHALDKASLGLAGVEDAWTPLPGAVSVLGPARAAVAGDCLAMVPAGRAIRPSEPQGASGHVAGAAYDAAGGRTLLTVQGFALAPACGALFVGQDPRNAPAFPSGAGDALSLARAYTSFTY